MPRKISPTVLKLSLVSLFTDLASEMLYPIMPLYLKEIGFTIVAIGVLEGVAEAVAGLSKGYFGMLSDKLGKRLPFVQIGYTLSALSKPIMGVFTNAWCIFSARSIDRIGKGVRTGARDALLSDEATPQTKGTVFGLHRSMDTVGAMLGPALSLVILFYFPGNYKLLFLIAFIPGVVAILFTLIIKEKRKVPNNTMRRWSFGNFIYYWRSSDPVYRRLTASLLLFALINSSDVFLLLKMKSAGVSDTILIGMYIFYNAIYALLAYPFGIWADNIGLKKMLIGGFLVFALAYGGFAMAHSLLQFAGLFLLYGAYAAATEGIAKAWISNIVPKEQTATAIGTYTGFQSIASLLASSIAGLIWAYSAPEFLFIIAAITTIPVVFFIAGIPENRTSSGLI